MYDLKVVEHKICTGVESREDAIQAHKVEYQWLEDQPRILAAKLKLYLDLTI